MRTWVAIGATALAICSFLGTATSSQAGAAQSYQWTPTNPQGVVTIGKASCPTAGWCVAPASAYFGADPSFATLSDGTWTITAAPVPTGYNVLELSAVSCPAVGWCVATGFNAQTTYMPVVETLSDGTWTPTTFTGGGDLTAVSCVAVGSCTAVDGGNIETLSGGIWTMTTPPTTGLNPASAGSVTLNAVNCAAVGSCVAVGTYAGVGGNEWGAIETLSEGTWTASTAPTAGLNADANPSLTLTTLACPALGTCVAVGTYKNATAITEGLIETLSSGTWTAQTAPLTGLNPSPASNPFPSSNAPPSFGTNINCPSVNVCLTVGSYTDVAGNEQGVVETLSGGSWSATNPSVVGLYPSVDQTNPYVTLDDVSCSAADSCVAVGTYTDAPSPYELGEGLIETLTDGVWSATTAPTTNDAGSELTSVTCPASGSCVAMYGGATGEQVGPEDGLIETQSVASPGYWEVATDGGIFNFGAANFHGSMGGQKLNAPIVGMATTPDGKGYWLVAADGGVFTFGDAQYYGSMGGQKLNAPIVGIAAAPDGKGYWLVASDGGVFNFGPYASFYGSMGGQHLNKPIVGIAANGGFYGGYWLVASDGGIFSFPANIDFPADFDATDFYGSMGGKALNAPIVGIAPTPDSAGYWEVASDGGIFSFGDAVFYGSMGGQHLNKPIVGITTTLDGGGYWEVAWDGGVFSLGDAAFEGSMGGQHLNAPVVATASIG